MNLRLIRLYCLIFALMLTDENLFDNEFRFYWILILLVIVLSDDIFSKNQTQE